MHQEINLCRIKKVKKNVEKSETCTGSDVVKQIFCFPLVEATKYKHLQSKKFLKK